MPYFLRLYSLLLLTRCNPLKFYHTFICKLLNNTITTRSTLQERDGFDVVKVHFERPNNDGFCFLDLTLPGEIFYKSFGFSEDEISK